MSKPKSPRRITTNPESPIPNQTSSQKFLDDVHRSIRSNLADADGDQPVEERVLRRGGLEARHRSEIAVRVVSDAAERHVNQRAVVGLQRDAQVELEDA